MKLKVLVAVGVCLAGSVARTQDEQSKTGSHGGPLFCSGQLQCEVLCDAGQITVYLVNEAGEPILTKPLRGNVTLSVPGDARRYRYDLYPQNRRAANNALSVSIDSSRFSNPKTTAEFVLYGYSNDPVDFRCEIQQARLTPQQIAIRHQRQCPVSGRILAMNGRVTSVPIGVRTVYLCCAKCEEPLKSNSAQFLTQLPDPLPRRAIRGDHKAMADQKTCPVMKKPLSPHGKAWKVVLGQRSVFVCCRGCIGELKNRPDVYLARLDADRNPVSDHVEP